ncbi:MAG: DUF4349 domain-containing protein [bacterium]|nr:DUF4349 domain-containing protein [bacterium]
MDISKMKKIALYLLLGVGAIVFVFVGNFYATPKYESPGSSSNLGIDDSVFGGSYATPSFERGDFAPAPMMNAGSSAKSGASQTANPSALADRKVVKVGALAVLVKKTEEAAEKVKSIAGALGGFVDGANIYNVSETSKEGTVTIRVPADKFDDAMQKLKEIAIKVDKEEIGAADVTEQFVDMEARLKNLKAEEAQYLKVLSEARKVEDILSVSERLFATRGNIERLEGQLKYLSSQIAMSSITVSLTEEADVQLFGIRWRPLFALKQGFRNMLSGLTGYIDAMIAFLFVLPELVLWLMTFVAGVWVAWRAFRFVKRKFFTPAV